MNHHKIKHSISNDGAHGVERVNLTIKHNTITRLSAMGLERFNWVERLTYVLNNYDTLHNTIEMTSNQANGAPASATN